MKYIFIAIVFFICDLSGQTNTFMKVFESSPGYTVFQMPYSAVDTLSSNSFVTAGFKMRWGVNNSDTLLFDSYIQKTEVNGLTKWFRLYHLNGYQLTVKDIKVLPNKDLLCAGQTNDYFTANPSIKHGILMRTDSNGVVQWCRLYPRQKIFKLLKRTDGNIGVLASDSGSVSGKILKIALLNSAGNLLWCKRIVSVDTSGYYGVNIVEGKNKSMLINVNYGRLILLDSVGNYINGITFATSSPGKGFHKSINNYNQGFYITGYNSSSSLVSTITKTDPFLNVIWYKSYQSSNGDSEFHNILALTPNNLLVFCEPENYGTGPNMQRSGFAFFDSSGVFKKSYLFTTDSLPILPNDFLKLKNGKVLFTAFGIFQHQFFGITDTNSVNFCGQTQITWSPVSSSPIINDNAFSSVNGTFNYSLVSVYAYQPFDLTINYNCSTGPVGPLDPTGVYDNDNDTEINLYPLPASDYLFIRLSDESKKHTVIDYRLMNSMGQTVYKSHFINDPRYFTLDLRGYTSGIYYLIFNFNDRNSMTKKILLQRQ